MNDFVKIALLVLALLLCGCKTRREAVMVAHTDTAGVKKMFHVEHYHDTTHTAVNRVIYIFDTIRVADTIGNAEQWARRQGVRAVVVENEVSGKATQSEIKEQSHDSIMAKNDKITTASKERSVDIGVIIGLMVFLTAVAALFLFLVYKYFGGR